MSENLVKSLELLIFGWGGVFIVLIIIYIACLLLTKLMPVRKEEK
ncbi:MAG: OadG-related small transporter subunit [Lactovum sp.]